MEHVPTQDLLKDIVWSFLVTFLILQIHCYTFIQIFLSRFSLAKGIIHKQLTSPGNTLSWLSHDYHLPEAMTRFHREPVSHGPWLPGCRICHQVSTSTLHEHLSPSSHVQQCSRYQSSAWHKTMVLYVLLPLLTLLELTGDINRDQFNPLLQWWSPDSFMAAPVPETTLS